MTPPSSRPAPPMSTATSSTTPVQRQHCGAAWSHLTRDDSGIVERLSCVRLRIHERRLAGARSDRRDARRQQPDLTLTWNPQLGKTASVVVQLEWASSGGTPNTQIFCQFTDNGSHAVEKRLANLWRAGTGKHVHAYRFLTSITNDGTDQLNVVSQYTTDSTHVIYPDRVRWNRLHERAIGRGDAHREGSARRARRSRPRSTACRRCAPRRTFRSAACGRSDRSSSRRCGSRRPRR